MSLTQLHEFLSTSVSIFTFLIAAFALWRYIRKEGLGGDFWGAVAIGEGLIVVEGAVGGILYLGGARPAREAIHLLYGVLALMIWPAAYGFTRKMDSRQENLTWLLVSAFLFGISLRARLTGGA